MQKISRVIYLSLTLIFDDVHDVVLYTFGFAISYCIRYKSINSSDMYDSVSFVDLSKCYCFFLAS